MNTVRKWIVGEYLEGIRISASVYDTEDEALTRCYASSRLGIECETYSAEFTLEADGQKTVKDSLRLEFTMRPYTVA